MSRFVIRNYGISRQFPYKGKSICLSNDQAIETDDVAEAAALGSHQNVHVIDRGAEFAAPVIVPPEKPADDEKKRKVTVNDAEAVRAEKFPPDEDEQQQEKGGTQPPPPESTKDKDEIAYAEMTVRELRELFNDRQKPLAKDKQVKTSGLKKAELILCLEAYDKEG